MSHGTFANTFRVAATYSGAIIGAGFASGQELTQFFVLYGSNGLLGIVLAGILFAWLGSRLLELGCHLKATGYHQLLYYVCGTKTGFILDMMIALFLFSVLSVMLAGAGTICRDQFGLPYWLGLAVTALAVTLTALRGIDGVTTANMFITPVLATTMLVIGLSCLAYHGLDSDLFHLSPQPTDWPAPCWPLASLLYVSYNLVLGAAIIAPLGASVPKTARLLGSLIGGLTLTLLAGVTVLAVMLHYEEILTEEIPMLYIAGTQHDFNRLTYSLMFVAAIYTTALTNLYGCAAKLHSSTRFSFSASLLIVISLSMLCSQFGFADLIVALYPIFGYAALWFSIRLCFARIP
ncbi:MAG: hypothetical protein ABFC57_13370 [Veillonellales bacterium]